MSERSRLSDSERVRDAFLKIGIVLTDAYDLLHSPKQGHQTIQVLLDLLDEDLQDEKIREGIVRALATPKARGLAGPALIRELQRTPKTSFALLWAIGNTMEVVIDPTCLRPVLSIVSDRSFGKAREMFVLALAKLRSEEAEQELIALLDDEEVVVHAVMALGKLKAKRAAMKINNLLTHPRPLVRREAQKALKRIDSG